MKPIKVAIVGAGLFSQLHADAYQANAGVDVAAIVDIDSNRAARAARSAGGAASYTDLGAVLSRNDIDAIDICTPNFTHAAIAIEALEAGKHVLVEKPPALSLSDFDRMTAAADASGATLTVGLVMRHAPWARELREAVEDGIVGRPQVVRFSLQSGMIWPGGAGSWQRNRALSGGHVVHNGMHLIDLANWILDDVPVEVIGRGFGFGPAIDDHWTLTVIYASGVLAVIEYSYTLLDPNALIVETHIVGERNAIRQSSLNSTIVHTAHGDRTEFDFRGDSMKIEIQEFIASARTGQPHGVANSSVRQALAVAIAGQESLVSGRRQRIEVQTNDC